LLADALLDGGPIGRVITRTGIRDYTAEPDALYPELKLGVLVGRGTRGTVEWLAAALQSNQRAVVFGELTSGSAYESDFVPLLDGTEVLRLPTAILEAPHGVRLLKLPTDEAHFASPAMRVDAEMHAVRPPWGVLSDVSLPMSGVEFSEAPIKAAEQLLTFNRTTRNALRRGGPRSIRRDPNVPSPGEADE
jgi:hypothetical protein